MLCDFQIKKVKETRKKFVLNSPTRDKETWWSKDDESNSVSEKRNGRNGKTETSKKKYLELKKKAGRVVYNAKCLGIMTKVCCKEDSQNESGCYWLAVRKK